MSNKIVVENKNIVLLFNNTNQKIGGIETMWHNIYKTNSSKEFVEFSRFNFKSKLSNEEVYDITFKNVEYYNASTMNNYKFVNCSFFINCAPSKNMYKSLRKIDDNIFSLEHGNYTQDFFAKSLFKKHINQRYFWKLLYKLNKHTYIKKSLSKKTIHIVADANQTLPYKNSFKSFLVIKGLWYVNNNLFSNNDFKKRNEIIFFGRNTIKTIDDQKNIKSIIKINEHIKDDMMKIKFYCWPRLDNENFIKAIKNDFEKKEMFSKAKYLIIYSKAEGYPVVATEALNAGVPIIMAKSFLAAEGLINKERFGVLFNLKEEKLVSEWIMKNYSNENLWNIFRENIINHSKIDIDKSIFNKLLK